MGLAFTKKRRDGSFATTGGAGHPCEIRVAQSAGLKEVLPDPPDDWRDEAMNRCERCCGGPCTGVVGMD